MKKEPIEKEFARKIAANLLYVATDLLRKGEVEEEWIHKITYIGTEIDGIEQMKTKPKEEYTKEELLAAIKEFRRLTPDRSTKRTLNKMLKAIEAEEELRWLHNEHLKSIVDFLPKYHCRKKAKKEFYQKAFSDWFKANS